MVTSEPVWKEGGALTAHGRAGRFGQALRFSRLYDACWMAAAPLSGWNLCGAQPTKYRMRPGLLLQAIVIVTQLPREIGGPMKAVPCAACLQLVWHLTIAGVHSRRKLEERPLASKVSRVLHDDTASEASDATSASFSCEHRVSIEHQKSPVR